jgi:hypothetical protein
MQDRTEVSPRALTVALAILAGCGGTTGLEHIDAGLEGNDSSALDRVVTDSATQDHAIAADARPETGGPTDGDTADATDAAVDPSMDDPSRVTPDRPPPKDTGATSATSDSSLEDGAAPDAGPGGVVYDLDASTESILAKQSPACLTCAEDNGCLDPAQQGGYCEQNTDDAGGPLYAAMGGLTQVEMCRKTMDDIFSSGCAFPSGLNPCICGDAQAAQCLAGTAPPNGAAYQDYVDDFNTTVISTIFQDLLVQHPYGAGLANALVACLNQSACNCFAVPTGDGG